MPRPEPSPPPAALPTATRTPLVDVDLRVVTPMFGGGATTREVDPEQPVTAKAVRGALRHWWRLCVSPLATNGRVLSQVERSIWGGPSDATDIRRRTEVESTRDRQESTDGRDRSSMIEVRVTALQPGQPQSARDLFDPKSRTPDGNQPLGYALFPFHDDDSGPRGSTGLVGNSFRLTLLPSVRATTTDMPKLQQAARAAVWAWVTFGGVGSRTRRGCGSLYCVADHLSEGDSSWLQPPVSDVTQWIRDNLRIHVARKPTELLTPTLSGADIRLMPNAELHQSAWRAAVKTIYDLRQGPGVGRVFNRAVPGLSFWPEADSLRHELGITDKKGRAPHRYRSYFPRADLGLPIIFQRIIDGDGDAQPKIQGSVKGAQRMASPILTKALAISPTHSIPLVTLLSAPHVWEGPGVEFVNAGGLGKIDPDNASLLNDRGKRIGDTRGKGRAPYLDTPSAREAFANFVAAQTGWVKV